MTIYWITEAVLPRVLEKVQAWQKKAAKLGLPPVTLRPTGQTKTEHMLVPAGCYVLASPASGVFASPDGRRVEFRLVEVEVDGTEPVLDGWRFAASVDHTVSDEANLINCAPGMEDEINALRFRRAEAATCDQCGLKRRRNKTYVVKHEDGRVVRVGSTCLQDFLPGTDPETFMAWMEDMLGFLREIRSGDLGWNEYTGEGSMGYAGLDAMDFVAEVVLEIELNGWLSRGAAWDAYGNKSAATANQASQRMADRLSSHANVQEEVKKHPVTDEHRAEAEAVLEWARALPVDSGNDYLDNLAVACRADFIPWKLIGIVGSAVTAYRRAKEQEQKQRAQQKRAEESEWQGEIGGRREWDLRVVFTRIFPGTYGDRQLTKMVDDDGNVFVWWATSTFYEEGQEVRLRGTVKDHDEYEDVKQTILTRCTEV